MKKHKGTIIKLLSYVKNYKIIMIASIIFAAISVVLSLYIPVLTGNAVDYIVDKGLVDFVGLLAILKRMGILIILTAIFQWLMNTCNNKIAYKISEDIRDTAFNKMQKLPLKYIDGHSHGDIVTRIISDVDTLSDGLIMGFTQFFSGVITIIGTLAFMLVINPIVALIVVILTPLSFVIAKFIAGKTFTMSKVMAETKGEQTSFIDEVIGNEKVVLAFEKQNDTLEQFNEINNRLNVSSVRAIFFSSLTNPCTRFVNSIVYAVISVIGAILVINGYMTVGKLSSFLSYASQYTKPFNEISGVITELQNALVCAGRVFEFIDEEEISKDEEDLNRQEKIRGEVILDKVKFSYEKNKNLIDNFNINVKPGQRVAIVGPTGCGKTTIINLLMRFYDVDEGTISIDGLETRKIPREKLRQSFGMVLQETWLKAGTIKENIAFGKPDASIEEIVEAAKKSHAHSFIKRLPNGYDTVIGEDGGNLSQGQKQLLCITRVMLCLPPMLILDEATSSIDTRTEIRIQKAFATMMEGRTSFIVAHRLSTIKEADIILVMKNGNIIEQGTHESLLEKNGFYANLYHSQFAIN